MEKTKQDKSGHSNNKTRFIVIREYSGSQKMQDAFEKVVEKRACEEFERRRESKVS